MADTLRLNTIQPAPGHKKPAKRVGRGIGSGLGKTCGAGHKGQGSRKSGGVRPGFEGGQMPLQIRLPKFGFTSRVSMVSAQVRLSEIDAVGADTVDLEALKAAGLVGKHIRRAKVFLSGALTRPVTVKGLAVTKGAKAAIEAAGGKVEA